MAAASAVSFAFVMFSSLACAVACVCCLCVCHGLLVCYVYVHSYCLFVCKWEMAAVLLCVCSFMCLPLVVNSSIINTLLLLLLLML